MALSHPDPESLKIIDRILIERSKELTFHIFDLLSEAIQKIRTLILERFFNMRNLKGYFMFSNVKNFVIEISICPVTYKNQILDINKHNYYKNIDILLSTLNLRSIEKFATMIGNDYGYLIIEKHIGLSRNLEFCLSPNFK